MSAIGRKLSHTTSVVRTRLKGALVQLPLLDGLQGLAHEALRMATLVRFSEWCHAEDRRPFLPLVGQTASYQARYPFYQRVLERERLGEEALDYLEFGVFKGDSLRWWCSHNRNPQSTFVGFDTFTGLPEAWSNQPVGAFSTGGRLPDIDDGRVSYRVGMFQATLPSFLDARQFNRRTVLHLDADIYSATLFVLIHLLPRLRRGDILLFDEFNSVLDEFRALHDATVAYPIRYQMIEGTAKLEQVALLLL